MAGSGGKHVITLKVKLETLGISAGALGGGGAKGAAGGTAATTAATAGVEELRKEFSSLAADVQAAAKSLKQLDAVTKALATLVARMGTGGGAPAAGATGAPRGPSPDAASERVAAQAQQLAVEAARAAAKASEKKAGVETETAKATTGAASALDDARDSLKGFSKAIEDTVRGATTASDKMRDIVSKAFKDMQSSAADAGQGLADFIKKSAEFSEKARESRSAAMREISAGKTPAQLSLEPGTMFEHVYEKIASAPEVKKLVGRAATPAAMEDVLKLGPMATDETRKRAEKLQQQMAARYEQTYGKITRGESKPKDIDEAVRALRKMAEQFNLGVTDRSQQVKFDPQGARQRLAAAKVVGYYDQMAAKLRELTDAIGRQADVVERSRLKTQFVQLAAAMDAALKQEVRARPGGRIFDAPGPGGQPTEGGADLARLVRETLQVAPSTPSLKGPSLQAFEILNRAARDLIDPAEAARKAFAAMADEGRGITSFSDSLRLLQNALRGVERESFDTTDQFLRFKESVGIVGGVRRGAGGALKAPGATDEATSRIFLQEGLQREMARVAKAGAGAKGVVELPFTTAEGNVKKLRYELRALGSRLQDVKVRAKDVSDNMFDRTSVRAALSRVATWGAAAGVVFGAVNALRQAVSTVVDTEAAIVSLGKVMNEAEKDFAGFERQAERTAIRIAQRFGQPLKDILDTMILFGQQGLNMDAVTQLTEASALAANVTTLDQPTAASALTAATEQFGVAASDAIGIVDKFNEVANNAAVTETVLAESLKKAGLAARNSGVDIDQFMGIVSAISEQTRQSGQEIGTALRFIFSRLTTPEAEKGLARVGIAAKDAQGNFRGFTPIINDLNEAFQGLSQSQKTQVAIALSGTRRYNTFLALMENFSEFQASTANSVNSAGSALKEQSRVAETASFRIQQLKNSLAGLAVSFGDSFLSPLKSVVDGMRGFIGLLTAVPGWIKTLTGSLGLGTLAFVKFSDHIVDFLGLAGSVRGAIPALGGAITRNLRFGKSREVQKTEDLAGYEYAAAAAPGLLVARSVADIGPAFGRVKKDAETFSSALYKSNLVLLDTQGNIVENTKAFTKFGATVRGYSTASVDQFGNVSKTSALSILGMNSALTRLGATLTLFSDKMLKLTLIGPYLFRLLDQQAAKLNATWATTLVTFTKVTTVLTAIYAGVRVFSYLYDEATKTGESIKSGLAAELAQRKEAIGAIDTHRARLSQLRAETVATTSAAAAAFTVDTGGGPENENIENLLKQEAIRRGAYKSSLLARQRLTAEEAKAARGAGFARPEVISSMDKFGNVVLKGAEAFETLARAVATTEERLLSLTQLKVIEGFIRDLKGVGDQGGILTSIRAGFGDVVRSIPFVGSTDWAQDVGRNTADKFREAVASYQILLRAGSNDLQKAFELRVPLEDINKNLAGELEKASRAVEKYGLGIERIFEQVKAEIRALPADAGRDIIEALTREGTSGRQFLEQAAQKLTTTTGKEVSALDLANQLLIQNARAFKSISGVVGTTPAETVELFNEKGVLERAIKGRDEVLKELQRTPADTLVLFTDIEGIERQALLRAAADGKKQLEYIADESGRILTKRLREALSETEDLEIKLFSPKSVTEEVNRYVLELNRVASGAGRGGLLEKDIDLGARFKFDLTGQQRAARRDEVLFKDLIDAQSALKDRIESIASPKDLREQPLDLVSPERVAEVRSLAEAFDKLSSIVRFREEIENVSRSFEQAAQEIESSRLGDIITAQFSGLTGAARGIIERRFENPRTRAELSPEELFAKLNPEVVLLGNTFADSEKAAGEYVRGLLQARRNIDTFVSDFQAVAQAGGLRDPKSLTQLAANAARMVSEGAATQAESLQIGISTKQLSSMEKSEGYLKRLVDKAYAKEDAENAKFLGIRLQQVARLSGSVPGAQDYLAERLKSTTPEQLRQFTTETLQTLEETLGKKAPTAVTTELIARREGETLKQIQQTLIRLSGGRSATGEQEGGIPYWWRAAVERFNRPVTVPGGAEIDPTLRELLLRAARPTTKSLEQAIGDAAAGRDFGLDPRRVDSFIQEIINQNKRAGGELAKVGQRIEKVFNDTPDVLRRAIEPLIRGMLNVRAEAENAAVAGGERNLVEEAQRQKKLAQRLVESALATQKFKEALGSSAGAIRKFETALIGVSQNMTTAIQKALTDLSVGKKLAPYTTTQFGALAGVTVPEVDLGKRRTELSGKELTALESPALARNLNDANTAFKTMVEQLRVVEEERSRAEQYLKSFQDEGDIAGVRAATAALQELGSESSFLESQVQRAQETLQGFGEAFRNLEAVNQLRVDIEKMFESFQKQRALEYDETSVQTAMGRTVFSFVRPTFEQFEQGQRGFLTKFERTLEDIRFQRRQGGISPEEASRGIRRAEFERDEELIALAQQRETRRLESAVQTAQQIRGRLFDFMQLGGPGAGAAQNLFNSLQQELETAGDILPGGGRRSIRDPRTGQFVDVPASQTMEFRGIPSLENIVGQVAELAQQARAQEARQAASYITAPLLGVLDTVPGKLDAIREAIVGSQGGRGEIRLREETLQAANWIEPVRDELIKSAEEGGRALEIALVEVAQRIKDLPFSEEAKRLAGEGVQVSTDKGMVSFNEFLRNLSETSGISKDVADTLRDMGEAVTPLKDAFEDLARFQDTVQGLNQVMEEDLLHNLKELSDVAASLKNNLSNLGPGEKVQTTEAFAAGGRVVGPGGPTSDRIPILASPGEYVINAAAASKLGPGLLERLNSFGRSGPRRRSGVGFKGGGAASEAAGEALSGGDLIDKAYEAAERGDLALAVRLYREGLQKRGNPPHVIADYEKRFRAQVAKKQVARQAAAEAEKKIAQEQESPEARDALSQLQAAATENVIPHERLAQLLDQQVQFWGARLGAIGFSDDQRAEYKKSTGQNLPESPDQSFAFHDSEVVLNAMEKNAERLRKVASAASGDFFKPYIQLGKGVVASEDGGFSVAPGSHTVQAPFDLFASSGGLSAEEFLGAGAYSDLSEISPSAAAQDKNLFFGPAMQALRNYASVEYRSNIEDALNHYRSMGEEGQRATKFGFSGAAAGGRLLKTNSVQLLANSDAWGKDSLAVQVAAAGLGGLGGSAAEVTGSAVSLAQAAGETLATGDVGRIRSAAADFAKNAPGAFYNLATAPIDFVSGTKDLAVGLATGDRELAAKGAGRMGGSAIDTLTVFTPAGGFSKTGLPARIARKLPGAEKIASLPAFRGKTVGQRLTAPPTTSAFGVAASLASKPLEALVPANLLRKAYEATGKAAESVSQGMKKLPVVRRGAARIGAAGEALRARGKIIGAGSAAMDVGSPEWRRLRNLEIEKRAKALDIAAAERAAEQAAKSAKAKALGEQTKSAGTMYGSPEFLEWLESSSLAGAAETGVAAVGKGFLRGTGFKATMGRFLTAGAAPVISSNLLFGFPGIGLAGGAAGLALGGLGAVAPFLRGKGSSLSALFGAGKAGASKLHQKLGGFYGAVGGVPSGLLDMLSSLTGGARTALDVGGRLPPLPPTRPPFRMRGDAQGRARQQQFEGRGQFQAEQRRIQQSLAGKFYESYEVRKKLPGDLKERARQATQFEDYYESLEITRARLPGDLKERARQATQFEDYYESISFGPLGQQFELPLGATPTRAAAPSLAERFRKSIKGPSKKGSLPARIASDPESAAAYSQVVAAGLDPSKLTIPKGFPGAGRRISPEDLVKKGYLAPGPSPEQLFLPNATGREVALAKIKAYEATLPAPQAAIAGPTGSPIELLKKHAEARKELGLPAERRVSPSERRAARRKQRLESALPAAQVPDFPGFGPEDLGGLYGLGPGEYVPRVRPRGKGTSTEVLKGKVISRTPTGAPFTPEHLGGLTDLGLSRGSIPITEKLLRELSAGVSETFRPTESLIRRAAADPKLGKRVAQELRRLQEVKKTLNAPFTPGEIEYSRGEGELRGTPGWMPPEALENFGFDKAFIDEINTRVAGGASLAEALEGTGAEYLASRPPQDVLIPGALDDIRQARGREPSILKALRDIQEELEEEFFEHGTINLKRKKFAAGGRITGPGGPTSDQVPILASPGEYVLNASAVNRLGLPLVDLLNKTGKVPRFAGGGLVGGTEVIAAKLQEVVNLLKGSGMAGAAAETSGGTAPRTGAPETESQFISFKGTGKQTYANMGIAGLYGSGAKEQLARAREGYATHWSQADAAQYDLDVAEGAKILPSEVMEDRRRREFDAVQTQRAAMWTQQQRESEDYNRFYQKNMQEQERRVDQMMAARYEQNRFVEGSAYSEEERKKFGYAFGGLLSGPGGPRGDRIPILASSGEYVVGADAVSRLGLPALNYINRTGNLPRFAEGGPVGVSAGGALVSVDTAAIEAAVEAGIRNALQSERLVVDAEVASRTIVAALAEVKLAVDQTTPVPLDIPSNGIKLDVPAELRGGVGTGLGADVLTRVEKLEGTVEGVLATSNDAADKVDLLEADMGTLSSTVESIAGAGNIGEALGRVDSLGEQLAQLEASLTSRVESLGLETIDYVNRTINDLQKGEPASVSRADLAREKADVERQIAEVRNTAVEAVNQANRALSQALLAKR